MKAIIIDNYDSFTFNLRHLMREAGCETDTVRNDRFQLDSLAPYDRIVLSPGPGIPSEAGLLLDVIRRYAHTKPILGVCLGHQAIAQVFGAQLYNLDTVCHGIQTPCRLTAEPDYIFSGLPREFAVGRYHSWAVRPETMPDCLAATALSPDGCIMALRHREYDVHGIQFHPESVLTPEGRKIIENFLASPVDKLTS